MGARRPITFEVDANGCHNCTSHALNTHGYPGLWKEGSPHNMHRVLYEEYHGVVLPSGTLVRHKCDNRQCINIRHLIEGSHAQNSADMKKRGRVKCQYGENHTDAVLTNAQVLEIADAVGTQYAIAARYGINQSTVSRIKNAQRRKDILAGGQQCKNFDHGPAA